MDNNIRDLRKAKKLTQDELARSVMVTRQTIISLENGRYDPSIRLAYKIAKLFDKKIEDVFNF